MKTTIIGVDGLGGSGKTTFSKRLQQTFERAYLFHLDDFIHPRKIRYDEKYEEWEAYYHAQWRYDYLLQTLIRPLFDGEPIDQIIQFYHKETDTYDLKRIQIPVGSTVILEGVFLQRDTLRSYFSHVYYIDVNKETRLARVLDRDGYIGDKAAILAKYENRYFPAEEQYVKEYNPIKLAHTVITHSF
ncbi:nucleoside/nucleotide kinase family protein [Sporosarcina sp. ITBMC105]